MAIKTDICKVIDCGKLRDKPQGSSMCVMHRMRWARFKSHDLPVKVLPEGIVHICKVHGELKEAEAYTNENYTSYQCIKCKKSAMEKFKKINPNRDTNALKKHYYIDKGKIKVLKTEYDRMFNEQNGVCAICKNTEKVLQSAGIKNANKKTKIKRLAIDHCHLTKKIRGLLCHQCNTMLGVTNSIIYNSEAAQDYLKKHAPT